MEASLTEFQQVMLRRLLMDLQGMSTSELAAHRSKLINEMQQVISEQSELRQADLRKLVEQKWGHSDIARLCGLTSTRIDQLMASGPRPERVLIGTGTTTTTNQVIIAVGGKLEASKVSGPPSPAISIHALAAKDELTELASAYGLRAAYEVIAPPGESIDLNRRNLVVVGSPRILPPMVKALKGDPNLGFGMDEDGRWHLTEGTRKWRSPADSGESVDLAYIGRLRRPDSYGDFLYIAGIHGAGTRGAVRYLALHMAEIYNQVGRNRWSALVRCDYDPNTHEIKSTELHTELRAYNPLPLHLFDPER